MQIQEAEFIVGATRLAECPGHDLPEAAFIGRSNVGKSSLINMLTGRKALAKVSSTPGKTRQLNFFVIDGRWCLVDLPGYGYARVAHGEQDQFNDLAADYLAQRPQLRIVFALVDSRLTGREIDLQLVQWLCEKGKTPVLVMTKADKLSARELREAEAVLREDWRSIGLTDPLVLRTSAKSRAGRRELLEQITSVLPAAGRGAKKTSAKKKPAAALPWLERMKKKHGI